MQWIARFSRAHIMIALTALVAFLSTFLYLQSLNTKILVARLKHDIHNGQVITRHDVSFVAVADDPTIKNATYSPSTFSQHAIVAKTDLSQSDLLTRSNTLRRSTNDGLQSLSIGVDINRANGGDIQKGDRVDIWHTGDESQLIAESVGVRNVILPNKRLGISTSQNITLVIAVTPAQAKELSEIIGDDDVMIVLATGSTKSESSDSKSDSETYQEFASEGN